MTASHPPNVRIEVYHIDRFMGNCPVVTVMANISPFGMSKEWHKNRPTNGSFTWAKIRHNRQCEPIFQK